VPQKETIGSAVRVMAINARLLRKRRVMLSGRQVGLTVAAIT
jgi:hypothetical protein